MLRQLKEHSAKAELSKKERKGLKKVYRTELVKRSALLKIVAAWVITVPASGLMAAMLYFTLRGMMLPQGFLSRNELSLPREREGMLKVKLHQIPFLIPPHVSAGIQKQPAKPWRLRPWQPQSACRVPW